MYKTEVQRVRESLIAQGKHPSVDAVRVALGNTGSKTTIHKYLKELEHEDGLPLGERVGVSDALQDLVGRLAAQLQAEADAVVAEAERRHQAALADTTATLTAERAEAAALRTALQASETALHTERTVHAATRQTLVAAQRTLAQLEERIAGLNTRLVEQEEHAASLEEKHRQAREALEHFRAAAKEQREQELRRHDHALQALQLELRQAAESLAIKNDELLKLNRDNGRLLEGKSALERELATLRASLRHAEHQLAEQQPLVTAHPELERRCATFMAERAALDERIGSLSAQLDQAQSARHKVEAERDRLQARVETLDDVLTRLERRPRKVRAAVSDTETVAARQAVASADSGDT